MGKPKNEVLGHLGSGVMKNSRNAAKGFSFALPSLQYSITPVLRHSNTPLLQFFDTPILQVPRSDDGGD